MVDDSGLLNFYSGDRLAGSAALVSNMSSSVNVVMVDTFPLMVLGWLVG
jgi:hypothetical protein